jgi:hypothetical protein
MRQTHWQLIVQELGGQDELPFYGLGPKVQPARRVGVSVGVGEGCRDCQAQ